MNIAVIGAGKVGGTIAKKWGVAGHRVTLGARDPGKPELQQLLQEIGGGARATAIAQSVDGADAVLFAAPAAAMSGTVPLVAPALAGKVVFDATNNMAAAAGGGDLSSIALIAGAAPSAHIYRAFNTLGWENFADPSFGSVNADLFYAGPDGDSRAAAEQLIVDVGLRPIWLGGLDKVRIVDSVLPLWFTLAGERQRGRHLAFKVLTD